MSFSAFAQQPYYNDVDLTLTGGQLRDELSTKVIATHIKFLSYTPGVWEACKATDLDPTNSNDVLLVYGYDDNDGNYVTDRTRSKNANGGDAGTKWNREHSYPKSKGTPNLGTVGAGADAHHLRPSDITFNAQRGSFKFIDGSGNARQIGSGWYPGDEWKGDIARMMLYMYIRYPTQCKPNNVAIGSTNNIDPLMINLLLDWNVEDPVSQPEKTRNTYHDSNANYAQGNRNPFIDEPYLATLIWGGSPAEDPWGISGPTDTQNPTSATGLIASNPTINSIDLNWTAATDNIGIVSYDIYVDGTFYVTTNSTTTSYIVTGLTPETTYIFTIKAKDAANNESGLSNSASETTLPTCGNESFEKMTVMPDSYGTRTWTGDSGLTWTATDSRTDRELNNKAITVRNGSLTASTSTSGIGELTVTTQREFSGGSGTFNVVVNGTTVGTVPYSDALQTTILSNIDIAGDVTVVFNGKASTSDRVKIDDLSWTCFNLLSNDTFNLDTISIFPNPVKGNSITIKSKLDLDYTIYDILGKKVLKGKINTTRKTVSVASLNKGVYLVQLKNETGRISKKLIKN